VGANEKGGRRGEGTSGGELRTYRRESDVTSGRREGFAYNWRGKRRTMVGDRPSRSGQSNSERKEKKKGMAFEKRGRKGEKVSLELRKSHASAATSKSRRGGYIERSA